MFDVLTIAAIADELTELVLDGRIQRVGHLDARSIGLEIYASRRRRYLVASADTQRPRVLLSDAEPAFDPELVTPFSLLLRKYARGGYIVGIEQPPLERILRVSIAKRHRPHNDRHDQLPPEPDGDEDEDAEPEGVPDATFVHLVVEIMGRHSNIILVGDDGRIMESAKRVTPEMSRVRPILPKRPYRPPPAIDKPDPRRLTGADAVRMLASAEPGETLAAALTRQLRAISPQIAREVAFRVAGDAGVTIQALPADAGASVAREVRHLLEPLVTATWSPQVYRDQDGEVIAFAPIPLAHLAVAFREEAVASASRAAELAEGAADAGGRHVQRRERLSAAVREARERVAARLASMREERARAGEAERYREWGELIFAYLWTLQPGQRELVAEGMTIPLDPTLTGKENAQRYFERYRKAQGAAERLPELEEGAERELAYLDQLLTQVAQAERYEELESLAAEWDAHQRATGQRAAGSRPYRRSTPPRKPRAIYDDRGNAIYVGRSGTENDAITFDVAGPNDTWLHARGVPGSHVVVRWRDVSGEEDEDTLRLAAALAAYYSAARDSTLVEVDLTRRRFVRKIKGAGPGLVSYRNERTIAVRPADDPRLRAR